MLLLRLWNYIRGYVIILVEGYFLEKFINICIHRQIFLWDIKKLKNSTMRLKVSISGFKMLRPVARKTRCRVRIVKKKGIPFTWNRYKRRKAFVIGAFAFVVIVYTLTSFIWAIEITGNKKIETEFLLQHLESMGIKPGILKYGISTDDITSKLMLDIKELAWTGVTVKGTKIKIEVAERKQPPELVEKNKPCDIVAAKDGVVKSMVVKTGQEAVKAGDTVTKGQVLISGAVPTKNEQINTRLVHAIGSVKARTWYEARHAVNTKVLDKERTGQQKDYYSLIFLTKRFGFKTDSTPYEECDRVEIVKKLSFGKDLELPLGIVIDRFYENRVTEREISLEEAKQAAMDEAYKEATRDIPEDAEIVNTDLNYVEDESGAVIANAVIECIEEIGVTKEIGGK
ncbi:MAG: sporulation protein YqfD [Clostridia bacterium]|nr:sporulation protein YqfD [Clostridia bacterium]